jgi:two-component system, NarL family, nitrate/nitrite response regulator NarL
MAAEAMPARVLLIDDHALFRRGVAQLIESDPDLQFVGEAGDGVSGVALAGTVDPDIVLIDLNMKGMNGIATLQGIKKLNRRARCIMLTVSDDERDVLEAMRAGADGYLLKDLEPEDLCSRLKLAVRGTVVLESRIASMLAHATTAPPPPTDSELTERENQILGSLALGHSNKEIARQLGISDATVKVHIKHLLRKLNLKSRLEAAVWALHRSPPRPAAAKLQ